MKLTAYLRVELRRLLRDRMTALLAALALAAPALGYFASPLYSTTMATMYLAGPIWTGTLAGALLFAVLTLYELDRVRRFHMDALTDAAASPAALVLARTLALVLCALLTAAAGCVLYLPVTVWKLGVVFSPGDYALCWLLLLFPGWAFAVLAAGCAYLVTRRTDVGALAVAAFLALSFTGTRADNIWWQWCLPALPALSDDFSNALVFRTALYNRLIWLCLLGGGWVLALLCLRRYGRGLLPSLARGLRRVWPGALALCLFAAGGALWLNQPFLDHSPVDWMDRLDVEEGHALYDCTLLSSDLTIDATDTLFGTLSGTAVYRIDNPTGEEQTLYLDFNPGLTIDAATVNGQPVAVTPQHDDMIATQSWACPLPADKDLTLELRYHGMPRIWNAQQRQLSGDVISARQVELSGKTLAPRPVIGLDADDTPITLLATLPGGLTPVTSGFAAELVSENADGSKTWRAGDAGELAMLLSAADYVKVDLDGGGIPIEFYYSRKHQAQLDAIDAVETMEAAVAYCTEHYGPRAFTEDKPFKILQYTAFFFGGFAKYNLSAISEDSFTVENMADPDKGADGAAVLAHEIIHQWWGLSGQCYDPEDLYWTDEGITTYTTYRLLEELRGADYAKTYCLDKWDAAVADVENNFYIRHPEYLSALPDEFAANIDAAIHGVNLYDGTARMLKRIEQLVGGQEAFDAILSDLYLNGGQELPPYVTLNDVLNACGLTKEAVGRE